MRHLLLSSVRPGNGPLRSSLGDTLLAYHVLIGWPRSYRAPMEIACLSGASSLVLLDLVQASRLDEDVLVVGSPC